ncbi:unnamed protein product [Symbiodinium necroappetens]|uniref:Uncharacterized protein n=1 Tax=Symbiodinium necroappetens TaxID=1628268 RepID=A0A813C5W4_9DINO|nr:unnamed protein product [Symbiodinium necroappetens]
MCCAVSSVSDLVCGTTDGQEVRRTIRGPAMAVPPSPRVGDLLTRRNPIFRVPLKPSQALLVQNWMDGNCVTCQTTATSGSTSLSFARLYAFGASGNGKKHGDEMELFLRRVQEDPKKFEHLIDQLRSMMAAMSPPSLRVECSPLGASPRIDTAKVKKCQTQAVSL